MEQLFQGSPLALLQLPPHQTGGLRPGNGQLIFSVRQHRQLFSVLHLMPENGFFSCDRPLPGLLPLRDMRSGALDLSSLYQPTLQSPMPLSVAAVSIDYPHTLEEALTRALLEERGGSATAASVSCCTLCSSSASLCCCCSRRLCSRRCSRTAPLLASSRCERSDLHTAQAAARTSHQIREAPPHTHTRTPHTLSLTQGGRRHSMSRTLWRVASQSQWALRVRALQRIPQQNPQHPNH